MTSNGRTLQTIDDRDPRLAYSGSWFLGGSKYEHNSTTHGTQTAGASVQFSFNGTFVSVFGTLGTTESSATFTVDGGQPVTKTTPKPSTPQYNYPLYFSPQLISGEHTLTITAAKDGDILWFDYLQYTGASGGFSTAIPTLAVQPSAASPPHAMSAGALAGIVVGAVGGVLFVLFVALFLRRRSSRRVRPRPRTTEKGVDILLEDLPKQPEPLPTRSSLRQFSFRRPARRLPGSTPPTSSSTNTSSAPTSVTQSSAMFTSVILLSPVLSSVSEDAEDAAAHAC